MTAAPLPCAPDRREERTGPRLRRLPAPRPNPAPASARRPLSGRKCPRPPLPAPSAAGTVATGRGRRQNRTVEGGRRHGRRAVGERAAGTAAAEGFSARAGLRGGTRRGSVRGLLRPPGFSAAERGSAWGPLGLPQRRPGSGAGAGAPELGGGLMGGGPRGCRGGHGAGLGQRSGWHPVLWVRGKAGAVWGRGRGVWCCRCWAAQGKAEAPLGPARWWEAATGLGET